jgi:hypothetical protein
MTCATTHTTSAATAHIPTATTSNDEVFDLIISSSRLDA